MKTISVESHTSIGAAIQDVLDSGGGVVRVGPGEYGIQGTFDVGTKQLALVGLGSNVTVIYTDALRFNLPQLGASQPFGLNIQGVSFVGVGKAPALTVSAGQPPSTSEHRLSALTLRDLNVSGQSGIVIEGVWNATLDNVYAAGDPMGGNWNAMVGTGIEFKGMCVNAHLSNVRTNFWATGIGAWGSNTEGLFCSNCSMVGVKRGVWLQGNPSAFPGRIHTFNWMGGMIENRVGGVTTGSAAFHLQNVHGASIQGCTMLTETRDCPTTTYGVIAQDCKRVMVGGCDITAYEKGVATTGPCEGILAGGNTFANVGAALEGHFDSVALLNATL